MKPKENQRVVVTKKMLQNGLLSLLEQKSIQKISVTELCRASGINRTTFYKHYSTPYDVLTDMGNSLIRNFLDESDMENSFAHSNHSKFCEDLCRYLYENADIMKVLIKYNLDLEMSKVLNSLPRVKDILTEYLQKSFKPEDVEMIGTFICSGGYSMIRKWIMEDIPKTPEEVAELILKLAASGWDEA